MQPVFVSIGRRFVRNILRGLDGCSSLVLFLRFGGVFAPKRRKNPELRRKGDKVQLARQKLVAPDLLCCIAFAPKVQPPTEDWFIG
ncbi:hypothetical protein [Pseudomonas sp. TMW 2.1634]|uniref:hypothetical protein n=1 Tax=Pseudomonas sp. TMW 2.1634 TaxID=1886807 RepID=UPI0013C3E861|nr:hypothetical protein [Pseudomonas sp. TMW 2.1634]